MAGHLRLSGRLRTMERRLNIRPMDTGVLEIHFPGAWPDCLHNQHGIVYERCSEHEDCGYSSTHQSGNMRRMIVMEGPWSDPPPLG